MNINEVYPSKYLKAHDIGDVKPICTIEKVIIESVGQGEESEKKIVVYFAGKDKGLVCNKTNAKTLSTMFGPETDSWIGKKIKLMSTEVSFRGEMHLALRISAQPVQQAA